MIKNYFRLAWRNMVKNRVFSLINISGLSMGIAIVLLTGAFIYSEFHINAGIGKNGRTYMLQSKWKKPGMGTELTTPGPLVKTLKENYPGLIANYYHNDGVSSIVSVGNKKFNERLQIGDSTLFSMFGFKVLYGNPHTAMDKPNAVVITDAIAIRYFGKTDVLGSILTIQSNDGHKKDFEITAIIEKPSYNTIMYYGAGNSNYADEFFLPSQSLSFFGRDFIFNSWNSINTVSYVELKEGVRPEQLATPVRDLVKLNTPADVSENLAIRLIPLDDYYLSSNNGSAYKMIYALGAIAFFILVMAIINFVNITIGNSLMRIKEIGVRKVMGSRKYQLVLQFLTESIMLTAFSVVLALFVYSLSQPFATQMLGRPIPALSSFPLSFLAIPVAIVFVVGIIAGSYPAFILSIQDSVLSLKGKMTSLNEKIILRRSMISLQFIVAIFVFVAALVINQQVNFFFEKDTGYNKERLITARLPRDWSPEGIRHMEVVRNEFLKMPEVAGATFSYEIPEGASSGGGNVIFRPEQDSTQGISAEFLTTDEYFTRAYNIKVIAGKFFNENGGVADDLETVLNESAVKALGWTNVQKALGEKIKFQGFPPAVTITGIVKDFHFGSMQQPVKPLFFIPMASALQYRYMTFRLNSGNISTSLSDIQHRWNQLMPDAPFDYKFVDETLANLYTSETRMKKASMLATGIALVIVLLGVAGIVGQSISKRTKEVGIRKVLGSSITGIILLFTKEFAMIFLVANAIAWPIGYLVLNNWLNDYAYRITLNLYPFALVAIVMLVLVAVLIFARVRKIAVTNPVNSLRTE